MRLPFRRRPSPFAVLFTYNAEVSRGIVHTPAWKARMAELQAEWDEDRESARVDRLTAEAGDEGQLWG